jgi:hypothetical protein
MKNKQKPNATGLLSFIATLIIPAGVSLLSLWQLLLRPTLPFGEVPLAGKLFFIVWIFILSISIVLIRTRLSKILKGKND